ncbi:glycosyl transferase [Vibrio sp. 10N.222.55.B11]|uniref:glycosyl transferase n=1 Tax=Vibrio sp. 10N.222.55.B11 TaxID=3229648 RepID=UPI00354BDCBF
MKILIVNYHFPPSTTAHSYRWALLRDHFIEEGHTVDVICGGNSGGIDEENSGIYRVNGFKRNTSSIVTGGCSDIKTGSISTALRTCRTYAVKLLKKVHQLLFWPDGLWHWLPPALLKVMQLKNNEYDLIVGYSPTFSAIIASAYAKKINKKSKLIFDYGDPFSVSKSMPVNNFKIYEKLNYFIENKLLLKADFVSLSNSNTMSLYRESFDKNINFNVIPHLVNVDSFYSGVNSVSKENFSIGYVGAFHKGIREPDLALKVLNKIKNSNFNFYFYGPLNGVEFCESENLKHYGSLERSLAINKMKEFDVIINVENESCPMTPSKIYECMATGKPIVNFLSGTEISSFSNYPLVFDVDNNTSIDDVENFINNNAGKSLTLDEVNRILEGKTVKSIAGVYLSLVR